MYILSIAFCFHDSSITISDENQILLTLEAERVYRKKHYRIENVEEMNLLIAIGLEYLGLTIQDISIVLLARLQNQYIINNDTVVILGKTFKPIMTDHQNNHIGTVYPSGFDKCLILCSDGGSESGFTRLYLKNYEKIELLEILDDVPFTGKFYGTAAQMIVTPSCIEAHSNGVGKFMGLSALGKKNNLYVKLINEHWQEMNELHLYGCDKLLKKFNLSENYTEYWKDQNKLDFAYNAHWFWVNTCMLYLKKYKHLADSICITGGCGLNLNLNSEIINNDIFKNVYIPPNPTDSGQSLGAILYYYPKIKCEYPYLGRAFGERSNYDYSKIADLLIQGRVLGWFQERSEIGPRALGHRSIFGVPTSLEMKEKISVHIKGRESFRPVAAIIPYEKSAEFFENPIYSPYMTFSCKCKEKAIKLAPAIVHNDMTCRIQTLRREDNMELYTLLCKLEEINGVPMLINTSFNIAGEPIVDSINDALSTFKNSALDVLVLNGNIICK